MKKIIFTIFLIYTTNFIYAQNDTVRIRAFIEGFYLGAGTMTAVADPANNPTICDTMTVRLLDTIGSYNTLFTSTSVISTTGYGTFPFTNVPINRSYFIQLVHRNSLTVFSIYPVFFDSTNMSYDFSVVPLNLCQSAAISNDGYALMHSGDLNQDGFIDAIDSAILDTAVSMFVFGYITADINGDHAADISDFNLMELNTHLNLWGGHPYSCVLTKVNDNDNSVSRAIVFPNPSNGILSYLLEDENDHIVSVEVIDIFGNVIIHDTGVRGIIDLRNYAAGLYFLFIQTQKNKISRIKLMKE